ncbi:unnamed protein product [Mucor fragilis]
MILCAVNLNADRDQPFIPSTLLLASLHHLNITTATLRPGFLYNQQDPYDVVYQQLALTHYLEYPPVNENQYTLVEDVFRILQQMFKTEGKRLGESSLYLATVRYLALVYKQLYGKEKTESMFQSQFVVIIPEFFKKDGEFIKDILRPLFAEAGWTSASDFKSKLVFFGELEAELYVKQKQLTTTNLDYNIQKIVREKRYMCCLIQRDMRDHSLMLTLNIVQMRYDKHFIAASRSSISCSEAQLLTPQFMTPGKTIRIQNWVSKRALQLPRFLLSRIFAGSSKKISFIFGDLYGFYLNNEYRDGLNLIILIGVLLIDYVKNDAYDINEFINKSIISTSQLWHSLDQEEKNNLAAIRYREIVEFLPLINMSSVLDEIRMYTEEHEFTLGSADDIIVVKYAYSNRRSYNMEKTCLEYQMMRINKTISNLTRSKCSPKPPIELASYGLRMGSLFKIMTMIDLSNKLKEPIVLRAESRPCNLELMYGVYNTREQAILEELPGYSFYVEAKIMRNQQIKLYIHEVIETQNGNEKSTLPIADTSIDIGDMYDTISDVLWNASQEHSSSDCASSLSVYDHYCNFKSTLTALLKEMFQNKIPKEEDIRDLQNINIGGTQCSCCVQISHYMILDMGVKHYLNSVARFIIACIKSRAIFGKYEAQTIIITGSLLYDWTKLRNTLYRDFIWKQLEEELCLSLYQHQMKVHLIMSHADIELFPDMCMIKREKYQQVVGKRRLLVSIEGSNVLGELYEDKGDNYELVPCIKIDGKKHWRLRLIENDEALLGPSGISSRYYFNPTRSMKQKISFKRATANFTIKVYGYSLQEEQDLLEPFAILKNTLILKTVLYDNPFGLMNPLRHPILGSFLPVVFTLKPENHQMKTSFSLSCSCFRATTTLLPGRITLKETLL